MIKVRRPIFGLSGFGSEAEIDVVDDSDTRAQLIMIANDEGWYAMSPTGLSRSATCLYTESELSVLGYQLQLTRVTPIFSPPASLDSILNTVSAATVTTYTPLGNHSIALLRGQSTTVGDEQFPLPYQPNKVVFNINHLDRGTLELQPGNTAISLEGAPLSGAISIIGTYPVNVTATNWRILLTPPNSN